MTMETINGIREDIEIGIKAYSSMLFSDVPDYIWEALLSIFCIGTICLITWRGLKAGKLVSLLLLAEYYFLLIYVTVICRIPKDHYTYNFKLFWSYDNYIYEIQSMMNVMVFIPIGLLIGCSFRSLPWYKIFLYGFTMSVLIEFLQLILKRGFSELDDVMHNTIGFVIGYIAYVSMNVASKRLIILCKRQR